MTKTYLSLSVVALFLIGSLLLCGCDGEGDEPAAPAVDISGVWRLSLANLGVRSMTLTQSGNSIQGSDNSGNSIAGSIEGNNVAFNIIEPNGNIQLNGTTTTTTMSGIYERTLSGVPKSSTWNAIKH